MFSINPMMELVKRLQSATFGNMITQALSNEMNEGMNEMNLILRFMEPKG